MPWVEPKAFYESLQAKKLASGYALQTEDVYQMRLAVSQIRALLKEGDSEFNYQVFSAGEDSLDAILQSLLSFPVFSALKIVVLRGSAKLSDSDLTALQEFWEKPLDGLCFVLVGDKFDRRKKVLASLFNNFCCVELKKPYANQIPSWIRSLAENRGLSMDQDAVELLHEYIGSELSDLDLAIQSLEVGLGDRRVITSEFIREKLARTKSESVFDFIEALARKDRVLSERLFRAMKDQGQNEIGILSLVARHWRILYRVQVYGQRGLGQQEMAQRLGLPPYFLKDYLAQSRRWTRAEVRAQFQRLANLDRELKRSSVEGSLLVARYLL